MFKKRKHDMRSTDPFEQISEAVAEATKDFTFRERLLAFVLILVLPPGVITLVGAVIRCFQ